MPGGDLLYEIQQLQFSARSDAEALLLAFVRDTFPHLAIMSLELRPQAISLNSFNGFLTLADGTRLFFKTHVEQDNLISEYYNAQMLSSAGYPVIQPLYSSTQSGQQLLIYPLIETPSVFDVARQIETEGEFSSSIAARLTALQNRSDLDLYASYESSLERVSADQAETAPIHQLFWHRLTGGRLTRFYGQDTYLALPHGRFATTEVFNRNWVINDSTYHETLGVLVKDAIRILNPRRDEMTIIGHGDAHNGNIFFSDLGLTYFDPAFAGRHSPILDLVKPVFHNVFAMWMYFPEAERKKLQISVTDHGRVWEVAHNYHLNPLRTMFFTSKFEHTLIPALRMLQSRGALDGDWRHRIKLALMCCPLLTMNLANFPPEIALLGLSFSIQMGAESRGIRSILDVALDEAEARLAD